MYSIQRLLGRQSNVTERGTCWEQQVSRHTFLKAMETNRMIAEALHNGEVSAEGGY